jgi:hypothetical protein
MKFNELIKSKIKERLKIIYQKRKNWNGARGPFNKSSILKRESLLKEQQILENLIKQTHFSKI